MFDRAGFGMNRARLPRPRLKGKIGSRETCLSAFKNNLFEFDIYGYTPSLIVTQFHTIFSLAATFVVLTLWLFAIGYTTYLWMSTSYSVSEGEVEHDNSTILVPPDLQSVSGSDLRLPKAGVFLQLGNGSAVDDPSVISVLWQQAVICHGNAAAKVEDNIPHVNCNISSSDGDMRAQNIFCADWLAAAEAMKDAPVGKNPCKVATEGNAYVIPRIAGLFYNDEYAYVTVAVSVNQSRLANDTAFFKQLYKGSVQLYLRYDYTGTNSLISGRFPSNEEVVWSRRVNLYPSVTMKWELSLRVRTVQASSFWWDIPQLGAEALDWSVESSEVSMAYNFPSSADAVWTQVAKLYFKLDDRDAQVSLSPYTNLFNLFSDWGGFLSILIMAGAPAVLFNQVLFRKTVKNLITSGQIEFNEEVRKKRSKALVKSFAVVNEQLPRGASMAAVRRKVLGSSRVAPEPQNMGSSHDEPRAVSEAREPSSTGSISDDSITTTHVNASLAVHYERDVFQDSDEESEDFDDIVRHCTSECHALYHLRQVAKLVQHEQSFLTCGQERMTMVGDKPSRQHSETSDPTFPHSEHHAANNMVVQIEHGDGDQVGSSSTGAAATVTVHAPGPCSKEPPVLQLTRSAKHSQADTLKRSMGDSVRFAVGSDDDGGNGSARRSKLESTAPSAASSEPAALPVCSEPSCVELVSHEHDAKDATVRQGAEVVPDPVPLLLNSPMARPATSPSTFPRPAPPARASSPQVTLVPTTAPRIAFAPVPSATGG